MNVFHQHKQSVSVFSFFISLISLHSKNGLHLSKIGLHLSSLKKKKNSLLSLCYENSRRRKLSLFNTYTKAKSIVLPCVRGFFVAMPRAIMRLVGTLTELLRVRELNPKFNRGPKSRFKG